MNEKYEKLNMFFKENKTLALAFSGGADSAFLLYAAVRSGADVRPYYVKTAFQPLFELKDAERLCTELEVELNLIELDVLADKTVAANPADRCYYCKRRIFTAIANAATADGAELIIDGTNASDEASDRPGMRALRELEVRSPLRECGITKAELREMSREAGLFTWNKPAYACLATRIPTGELITAEMLEKVENAETVLFDMGYTDFRVRTRDGAAKLQFSAVQKERADREFSQIQEKIRPYFEDAVIDSVTR